MENIVPLADPGTLQSLVVPLSDEQDHVAFGVNRLRDELAALPVDERESFLASLPLRIENPAGIFAGFGLNVATLFERVGADYGLLCSAVRQRRDEVLETVAA